MYFCIKSQAALGPLAAPNVCLQFCTLTILTIILSACQNVSTQNSTPPRAETPASAPKVTDVKSSFNDVIRLLEDGKDQDAVKLLDAILVVQPAHREAQALKKELDAPLHTGPTFAYTVGQGETLSELAKRFLRDPSRFPTLARLNGILVPKQLQAGTIIRIPGKTPPPSPGVPHPAVPPPSASAAIQPTSRSSLSSAEIEVLRIEGRQCMARTQPDCAVKAWAAVLKAIPNDVEATHELDLAKNRFDSMVAELRRQARLCENTKNLVCSRENWTKLISLMPEDKEANEAFARLR